MNKHTWFPLRDSYLCADTIRWTDDRGRVHERMCNAVGNNASQCVCCGSKHGLISLATVFDGRPPRTLTEDDQNMLRCWHIAADK